MARSTAWPLATSGKLDRKIFATFFMLHQQSIRDMEGTPGAIRLHAMLRTEIQVLVRSFWASVLHLNGNTLGIDDDFYTSGGIRSQPFASPVLHALAAFSYLPQT
jgi:hypothetical protein